MRHFHWARTALMCCAVAGTIGCTMEQTREGETPDIDVDAGRLPAYDVNWADVDVGTTERTVTVPVVRVEQETREITVPYIDVNAPGDSNREERTITMEVDVPHAGYDLSIEEVRAVNDDLWVIARLTEGGDGPSTQAITRASDQVVVNAPADLDVRKVVIGERPSGVYNQQYRFFDSESALDQAIPSGARTLYQRGAQGTGAGGAG